MKKDQLQQWWRRILLLAFFIFAIVSNIRLIIRNYQLHERVRETQASVDQMSDRNVKLKLLLGYYQSASYQEVEARRRLGVKKPDETAYSIKGITLPDNSGNELETTIYKETPDTSTASTQSNFSRWIDYFKGKK